MTYDHEVTLIDYTYTGDELKQQIPEEVRITILCGVRTDVGSAFSEAGVDGIKPELVLVVHKFEYTGQAVVEFQGKKRKVVSTYTGAGSQYRPLAPDEMELKCGGVIGLGD